MPVNPSKCRVLAIGGGGFLMEDGLSAIDAQILRLTSKPKPKVCFIPTASGDLPEHIERFYTAFDSQACEPSHLPFFRKPTPTAAKLASFRDHLLSQDTIYVGGGNTKSALGTWREWGADEALRAAYRQGVLLAGMSAGAICWFEAGWTDSVSGAGYTPLPCLGLLSGGCGVHRGDPDRIRGLRAAVASGAMPRTIDITDHAAVLFENGVAQCAYRWREEASAWRLESQSGITIEKSIPCAWLGSVQN